MIVGDDDPQGVRGPVPVPQPRYPLVVAWALVPHPAGLGGAAPRKRLRDVDLVARSRGRVRLT